MSKFNCGEKVFLFNSISLSVESDVVYAVLFVPVAVEGREQHGEWDLANRIGCGEMEVKEQYQLSAHQGVVDAECLFGSEAECRAFFRKFFSK